MKLNNIISTGGGLILLTGISFFVYKTEKIATAKTELLKQPVVKKEIAHHAKQAAVSKTTSYIKNKSNTHYRKRSSASTANKAAKPLTTSSVTTSNVLFTTNYLPLQEFIINPERDTQLVAKGGMTVIIPKDAFTFQNGEKIRQSVTVQIKEAFTKEDIVLANLLTKKGNDLLESGGMFYLNAQCEGKNLQVTNDKQLRVEVPSPNIVKAMELYEGKQTDETIDWQSPLKLTKNAELMETALADAKENFAITPLTNSNNLTFKEGSRADTLGWVNREAKIFRFKTGNYNDGKQDKTLKYVMETKRLGWANIDCLYHDPRSRQISFVTEVANNEEFKNVSISMMFKSKRVYLPGYQKADGTYSFTHGDYEEPVMPVGEKAVIMVSAHKNGQQYFDVKEIVISDHTFVAMELKQASMEEIKVQVQNSL